MMDTLTLSGCERSILGPSNLQVSHELSLATCGMICLNPCQLLFSLLTFVHLLGSIRCLRTYLNHRPVVFDERMIHGEDGRYVIEFNQVEYNVGIELGSFVIDTYPEEDDLPLVGLLTSAIKQHNPHLEILYCKEYSLAYDQFQQQVQSWNRETEVVDWISECASFSICSLPRPLIHKFNLLHRGIGALILDDKDRIFVHQRSSSKRLFPSMYDMLVGGVSASKESPMMTLFRELNEELGIDLANSYQSSPDKSSIVEYLGNTVIQTSYNHCYVDCYMVRCPTEVASNLRFNDGEVEWGQWMTSDELQRLLDSDKGNFVPDGLQVWEAIPTMMSTLKGK